MSGPQTWQAYRALGKTRRDVPHAMMLLVRTFAMCEVLSDAPILPLLLGLLRGPVMSYDRCKTWALNLVA
jgi:hypothetical protein